MITANQPPTLPFTRWRLDLRVTELICFGTYPGSALRGGLGDALKAVACCDSTGCPAPGQEGEPVCRQPLDCLFGYAFESRWPAWAGIVPRGSHVPHPFILEPPFVSGHLLPQKNCENVQAA